MMYSSHSLGFIFLAVFWLIEVRHSHNDSSQQTSFVRCSFWLEWKIDCETQEYLILQFHYTRCVQVDAREATPAELSTVHTEDHISLMQELGHKSFGKKKRRRLQETFDSIYFNEGSAVAALLAAGSVIEVNTLLAKI